MCEYCGWIRCPVGCPSYDPFRKRPVREKRRRLTGVRFVEIATGGREKRNDKETHIDIKERK